MKWRRFGQSSLEFLIVVGFATLLLIPAFTVLQRYASSSIESIESDQIQTTGQSLVQGAENLYFRGNGSRTTVVASLPSGVTELNVINISSADGGSYLYINYTGRRGANVGAFPTTISDLKLVSRINAEGTILEVGPIGANYLSEGRKEFRLENLGKQADGNILVAVDRFLR